MENFVEIDFITRLYESAKADLYTLLVDGSTNKLEYTGNFDRVGGFVTIEYTTIPTPGLDYISLLQVCRYAIIGMLKRDIKLWSKTELVEDFWFFPKVNSTTLVSMSVALKAES